ncbi:hypothetical protein GPECTOR_27g639 [Gonium pectorale]|uniref:Uncharacterized protein n=1 Tax=Gonium pectorale TaxID=33097 RepID=A0A150GF41_GONPE|nr:hypothetical protein GPECTOR_27g639 [Gonium pectorale]|eukprot:KXZ48469.1 hypothetical protein GPECTOR_27g639 [Gonium pectorale]
MGLCLATANNATEWGSKVVLANCVKGDLGQMWKTDIGYDGGFRFQIGHADACLTLIVDGPIIDDSTLMISGCSDEDSMFQSFWLNLPI